MTLLGILFICGPTSNIQAPEQRDGGNGTRPTNNNMPDKSHVIIIVINILGQIIQFFNI